MSLLVSLTLKKLFGCFPPYLVGYLDKHLALHLYLQFYVCGSPLYLRVRRVGNNSFVNKAVGLLLKVIYDFLNIKCLVYLMLNTSCLLLPYLYFPSKLLQFVS